MMRLADTSLSRIVHEETHESLSFPIKEYKILGMITRYGDLSVVVMDNQMSPIWTGTNIMQARAWLLDKDDKVKAIISCDYFKPPNGIRHLTDDRRQQ